MIVFLIHNINFLLIELCSDDTNLKMIHNKNLAFLLRLISDSGNI